MSRGCAETGAVSRPCGPDRSGQSDLLQVIFGMSGRRRLKNEPLKTLGGRRVSAFLCSEEEPQQEEGGTALHEGAHANT